MNCQDHVDIHKCDGTIWRNVPATVTSQVSRSTSAQAFSTPILRRNVAMVLPYKFDVGLQDAVVWNGERWQVESAAAVKQWGRTSLTLACSELTGDCVEVEVRQWSRRYGCTQADTAELTHTARAVIHHIESRSVQKMDGMIFEHRYRIYLEPSVAHILTIGNHIVHESRNYDIESIQYLTDIGRVPYAECVSYG